MDGFNWNPYFPTIIGGFWRMYPEMQLIAIRGALKYTRFTRFCPAVNLH
jgi:hypothetical protein